MKVMNKLMNIKTQLKIIRSEIIAKKNIINEKIENIIMLIIKHICYINNMNNLV